MIYKVRPFKYSDLGPVMEVENASFPLPWEEEDFITTLKLPENSGLLAETHGKTVGYIVYQVADERLIILSIAVAPDFRRRGIGKMLMEQVIIMLNERRPILALTACDTNLEAHLFFRNLGFRATGVAWNFYGPGNDGYEFEYHVGQPYKYNKNKQLDEACQGK